MSRNSLSMRVAAQTCAMSGVLALGAAWLGGGTAAVGVLAGAAIAVLNFLWLARGARRATTAASPAGWALVSSLRLLAVALACAALLSTRAVHPLAIVIGLTVLPCALIARGLAAAREA
jgi:ATP synthase I subunit